LFLAAIGLFGILFGVGASEVRRFENAAARDISSRLKGEQMQVKVRTKLDPFQALGGRIKSATITASHFTTDGLPLFTEPERWRRGRLDELKIQLSDFELSGLQVSKLEARIPNCRFDWGLAQRKGKIRLTQSGTGTGLVEVSRSGLLEFMKVRHPTIRNVKMELADGQIHLTGTGRFMTFEADVEIESRLESPDGYTLHLTDAHILVNGQQANPVARQTILKLLNPVLDLNQHLKLFRALKFDRVEILPDRIRASGVAQIPDHPMGTWMGRIGLFMP
jgi:hypothetical protein